MRVQTLKKIIYKIRLYFFNLNWGKGARISFMQATGGEDQILKKIFQNKLDRQEKGCFIDVGAWKPIQGSNTYYFYKQGWTGINIEPRPGSKKLFDKIRSNDINLEAGVGIGDEFGEKTYFSLAKFSTCNTTIREEINKVNTSLKPVETKIDVFRLEELIFEYNLDPNNIDFLSIDVEGAELEILSTNNWDKYRPKILIVEQPVVKLMEVGETEIAKFLEKINYLPFAKTIAFNTISNVFYFDNKLGYDKITN